MTRLPGLLLGGCLLLAAIGRPALAFQVHSPAAGAQVVETRIITGLVEVVNGRSGILEVRAPNGRLFLVEARGARFEAATPTGPRLAEFVNVRPGSRVDVTRRTVAGRPGGSLVVRILGIPSRATEDPFAPEAPVRSLVRGQMAIGGTVRTIDRLRGVLVVRSGGDDMTIRVPEGAVFEGFDIRNPDLTYLRVGDPVTVLGFSEGEMVVAERLTLNAPNSASIEPVVPATPAPRTTPKPASRPPSKVTPRPASRTAPKADRPATMVTPSGTTDGWTTFGATIVRANADRTRIWVRTPQGERALRIPVVVLGSTDTDPKLFKPGEKIVVTARRQKNEWLTSSIELQEP